MKPTTHVFIVRDSNRFPVAYVCFESEPGRRAAAKLMTKDEVRKVAAGIAKLPELLPKPRDEKPRRWQSLRRCHDHRVPNDPEEFRAGHEPEIQKRDSVPCFPLA
jgi:hypothetical protein